MKPFVFPSSALRGVVFFICSGLLIPAAGAAVFTVDSTADTFDAGNTTCASPCTFRQAITVANNTVGTDTIAFNIPGSGERLITVTTPLPSIEETAHVDGYTQPGTIENSSPNTFNGVLMVRIQGSGMPSTVRGIALCASGSSVRGLSIGGFGAGQIAGGVRANGTSCPTSPIGNLTISGNLIGIGTDGTTDLSGSQGLQFLSSNNSVVGGPTVADRNVISGFVTGLTITNATTGFQVLNNVFGANAADTASLPNSFALVVGGNVTQVVIGTLSAPNLFAGNGAAIQTATTSNNIQMTGNLFRLNAPGMGIDLNNNGAVNPNDVDDVDSGANGLQNFPVITSATTVGADLLVSGSLDVGNATDLPYELSVYATDRCDETGHGEGEILLGVQTVNLRNAAEGFALTVPYGGPTSGRRSITMLASHPTNGTSEFSQCFRFDPTASLIVNTTDDVGDGLCTAAHCSLRDALLHAAAEPGLDLVTFAIPGTGPHRITPTSGLPALTQPVTIDGYTQPGAAPNTHATASNAVLKIILDMSGTTQSMFTANIAGSTIRGISFVNAPSNASVIFSIAASTTVAGNWFGVEPDGTTSSLIRRHGIGVAGQNTVVGGPTVADRNVFANFFVNTAVLGTDNSAANLSIENNLFGLLPNGQTGARNASSASWVTTNSNPVVIRNNTFGCATNQLVSIGTLIESNEFGLSVDGLSAPTGTCDAGTITARSGARMVGNRISSRAGNGRGIDVGTAVTGVVLDRNLIFDVASIEIDLGNDGPTGNDTLDPDTGANNRQNHPLITSARRIGPAQLEVSGSLNSLPNTAFELQFFADETIRRATAGTYYANARWVSDDTLTVTTDASGNATFSSLILDFTGAGLLGAINATATRLDAGNIPVETSELSPAQATFDPAETSFVVTNTDASGVGSFSAAVIAAEANPDSDGQRDLIEFSIPGTGPFIITPSPSILTMSGRVEIDGTSQPGASTNTDDIGTNAQNPIELRNVSLQLETSADAIVRGLSISSTSTVNQPFLRLGPNSRVLGNFIGVRSDGVTVAAASISAALIDCINGCGDIGDGTNAGRNLIANPTSGDISAIRGGTGTASIISGNLIGVQRNGTQGLINVASTITGPGATTTRAILSRVATAPGDLVTGNVIGSGIVGIRVEGQGARIENNLIGGRVVSGNLFSFRSASAGVWINGGDQHRVRNNLIRNNGGDAIDVATATTQAELYDNTSVGNSGLAIDLGSDGPTTNDTQDTDTGANGLQNHPVISDVTHDPSGIVVSGTLTSLPSTTFRLRFCFVQTADSSNRGECDQIIPEATMDVTTPVGGTIVFTTSAITPVAGMTAITATAAELRAGREVTSEFAVNAVIRRATTVSLSTAPQPSLVGQPFTTSVSVSSTVGGPLPTGSVSISTSPNVGSCTIATLTSGLGSCAITPTQSGSVSVTASFSGSTTTLHSSQGATHQIDRVSSTLAITNDSPDPSTPGASFTVTFTAAAPSGVPTGLVTVQASGGGSCSATLSAGQGFCLLTPQATGNLTLTAEYPGSAEHSPSQDTESHDVGAAASTMSIQSVSPSPSVFGQPVTVTAQASATVGTPSGPITVTDGAGASCEITGGNGSCVLVPVNVGTDITLRAEFVGNAGHTGSFATTTHIVNRAEVILTVGVPFRADTGVGQPAQNAPMRVPVTLAAAAPGAGTPGGTIVVESVLGNEICVIVLPELFCDLTPLGTGPTDFTASYIGDTRFNERLEPFSADILPSPLFGNSFECEDVCP